MFVATANDAHCEIAVAAASAGLHVFCEKAMARDTAECWRMAAAAEENSVRLVIGHKRRLRRSYARMLELVRDERLLGPAVAASVTQFADGHTSFPFGSWYASAARSGGPLQAMGVHVCDFFRALMGDVARVTAHWAPDAVPLCPAAGGEPAREKDYDYPAVSQATFVFQSGAIASLQSSLVFPLREFHAAQGPTVQCVHGGMEVLPTQDTITIRWRRNDALGDDALHVEEFPRDDSEYDPAFHAEIEGWVRWIREGEACQTAPRFCLGPVALHRRDHKLHHPGEQIHLLAALRPARALVAVRLVGPA